MTAISDTNIVIFLVQSDAPSSTERVAERVVHLAKEPDEMNARIIIPAPVLAETLSFSQVGLQPVPPNQG